jgi:cytochrome c-type biogenesis protein CcmE
MSPYKKQRLFFLALCLVSMGLGAAFLLFVFRDHLVYFYSPSELPVSLNTQQVIRIGGLVEKGSLEYTQLPVGVRFRVTDGQKTLVVEYQGALPDLFREGKGVVVEGTLQADGIFKGRKVLARHDENYMPPEVQQALDAAAKKNIIHSLRKE